eukprot:CAMPEP_0117426912 /NCGR_PEP_ID=MMETSP0758-20121206/6895_1 /TAXON_ID=63605 /ORGANISM="Percolomonas cosmopolitus, Strain AE-1 (ATCC 50343)" /LENGTH=529 /DNA_ID=CAMNT_0005212293 /DNA_START=208 /DNA_END=1797 /DNA_ORIENTATION=+
MNASSKEFDTDYANVLKLLQKISNTDKVANEETVNEEEKQRIALKKKLRGQLALRADTKNGVKYLLPINGFPKELQKKIIDLRKNPNELYGFQHDMKQELKRREAKEKTKPKRSCQIVKRNATHLLEDTRDQRLMRHLEEREEKRALVDYRLHVNTNRQEHLQEMRLKQKQQRIEMMSTFKSPAERVLAFRQHQKQRSWLKYVALGMACSRWHAALTEDRKTRIHTVQPSTNRREIPKKLFAIHKRRLLMDIRNDTKDDITVNKFIARTRYLVNRRRTAASLIRGYLEDHAQSLFIIQTIRSYKFCVIRAQRFARRFLQVKRAQEALLAKQFQYCERVRNQNSRAALMKQMSSIDTTNIPMNDLIRHHVSLKRLRDNASFVTVAPEIRMEVIQENLRLRRKAYIKKQVAWDRKFRKFREEENFDVPSEVRGKTKFKVLLTQSEMTKLVIAAENRTLEQGRKLQADHRRTFQSSNSTSTSKMTRTNSKRSLMSRGTMEQVGKLQRRIQRQEQKKSALERIQHLHNSLKKI